MRKIIKTRTDFEEAQEYVKDGGIFAIDTETCPHYTSLGTEIESSGALRHTSVMLGYSISKDSTSGFFMPYFTDPCLNTFFDVKLFKEMVTWSKQILNDPKNKWIMHNALFDINVLERHLTRPKILIYDTQIAAHEINENRSLGLKPLSVEHFGADADEEKRAMKAWCVINNIKFNMGRLDLLPLDIYGTYAIKDTELTYALFELTLQELDNNNLLNSFQNKRNLIPIYNELYTTGWPVDRLILQDNSKVVEQQIQTIVKDMISIYPKEIKEIEQDILDHVFAIKNSPTWKKLVIGKEGYTQYFTEPLLTKRGKPNKNVDKFTTSTKFIDKFIADKIAPGSVTEEFIQWDGDMAKLSVQSEDFVRRLQKTEYLSRQAVAQQAPHKIVLNYVFNPSSNDHLKELLFVKLGMAPVKFSKKAQSQTWAYAEIGSDSLERMQKVFKEEDAQYKLISLILQLRDKNKIYGTYLIGLQKLLYTAKDLDRVPERSSVTGRELEYLVSSINMTGTKTGRCSSDSPNLLNLVNDAIIKDAFVVPIGYKLISIDYAAQEVRETGNITRDAALKDVFTVKCKKCNTFQSEEIRTKIAVDPEKAIYWLNLYETETNKPIGSSPTQEICCPNCNSFSWTEPDPHSLAASRIFDECKNLGLDEIKAKYGKTFRQDAKVIQFTILYGGSAYTLADRLYKSNSRADQQKAQDIIDNYFKNAPDLKNAIQNCIDKTKKLGYVEARGGYRRHLPDIQLTPIQPPRRPSDLPKDKSGCYGKVDLDWDDSMPKSDRLSSMVCPVQKGSHNNCQYHAVCKQSFIARNVQKLIKRAERQAFNCIIQSSSAYITNMALKRFYYRREELSLTNPLWSKVRVTSQIYDCIYAIAPEAIAIEARTELMKCMEYDTRNDFIPMVAECQPLADCWSQVH